MISRRDISESVVGALMRHSASGLMRSVRVRKYFRGDDYCKGVRNPASFVLSSTVIVSWPAFRTN